MLCATCSISYQFRLVRDFSPGIEIASTGSVFVPLQLELEFYLR